MSAPLVTLREVAFRYRGADRDALSAVSLDVPSGEITAVLGPNGSGKTTLLHLLLGLNQPRRGQVVLAGRSWQDWPPRERARQLCLVPQHEPVGFPLTVEEYTMLGRAPHLGILSRPGPEDRAAVVQALDDAGILELRHRSMMALSGGERQLVTVARALAQDARLVLMDEPSSHLDLGNTQRVLALMRRVRAAGRAVVFTTHDPNAALAVARQVVLLEEGRTVACGPAEEVLTAELLSAAFGLEVEVLEHGRRRVIVIGGEPEPA
jgi:iron complex transport system ATP-binding protein